MITPKLLAFVAINCTVVAGLAADSIPPAAWQQDPELAAKWQHLTGKYIFQVACVPCHQWGPEHWPRTRWDTYLKEFPGNHDPDIRNRYSDLTAVFEIGKAVPTREQERDALKQFLLSAAPADDQWKPNLEKPFEGFPAVGSLAPDFSVTDVAGRTFSLSDFKDKRALVLVFSRAHW